MPKGEHGGGRVDENRRNRTREFYEILELFIFNDSYSSMYVYQILHINKYLSLNISHTQQQSQATVTKIHKTLYPLMSKKNTIVPSSEEINAYIHI